ncbi:MAG: transketolase [Myxococcales bacterium]|nr:transketolase [Myxococcales bacterium]
MDTSVSNLAANTLRVLAMDAVNAANSGHPGAPMGLADLAVVLWTQVMRYDPKAPAWIDRDRFVLSNGHASMLLYGALHLAGYDLSIDDIKQFRQLHSKTPGHPEYGMTPGVETTTGPLGQGFANAVGMALATRMLKARFGGHGFEPITHRVFGIMGDGCMMEGVASEAASVAGHLGLGELVFVYDDNHITIDGKTDIAFSEDVEKRYQAYGWHTLRVADGHDQQALLAALETGRAEVERPTLILARTHIGFGSPNRVDSSKAHGEPMGAEEAARVREALGWTLPPFEVPDEVRTLFAAQAERGAAERTEWESQLAEWRLAEPELATLWDQHFGAGRRLAPDAWKEVLAALEGANTATRAMSGKALNVIAKRMPNLVGGSADLAGSNKSDISGGGFVSRADFSGRNIHFGIREHAMAAITNGLALSDAFVPFGATFLTFSDYNRPALRLSALMKIRALQIFTHDSIGLGEDGPTHQSVEHVWALRMIPGLYVWRPADGVETAMTWAYAAGEGDPAPHVMAYTRQNVPALPRPEGFDPRSVWRGGYVLKEAEGARVTFIATGSEVDLALQAGLRLEGAGVTCRVVSMPCLDLFLEQDEAYKKAVLGSGTLKVSVEAGISAPWAMVTGLGGLNLGVDTFGESAPAEVLYAHFGLTPEAVAEKVQAALR